MRTVNSPGCEYERGGFVLMPDPGAHLSIDLPVPTERLVVGVQSGGEGTDMALTQVDSGEEVGLNTPHGVHGPGYGEFRFASPGASYVLRLGSSGIVSFVGYEG
jgi:hypothetical protein